MTIKDITGKKIEVTNLHKAIKQCKLCQNSPYLMDSGHTVGENHNFMLRQLEKLKRGKITNGGTSFSPPSFLSEPDAEEKKQKTK